MHSWEAAAVEANFAPGSRVVVTSAGAGREVIALLQQGFDAVGYEPNRTLVATGSGLLAELEHGERLRTCDRDAFPDAAAPCDGIVVGWGGYSLICGPGTEGRVPARGPARPPSGRTDPLLVSHAQPEHPLLRDRRSHGPARARCAAG